MDLLPLLKAVLAFLTLWFGYVLLIGSCRGRSMSAINTVLPFATGTALALVCGVFGKVFL